jgi:hypothetical protein
VKLLSPQENELSELVSCRIFFSGGEVAFEHLMAKLGEASFEGRFVLAFKLQYFENQEKNDVGA